MTPLPTPSAMAGSGRVNATALDAVIRQIAAQINALITALGVARGEDRQLADKSLQWRMVTERLKGDLREMIDFVAAIRKQYHPQDMCPKGFGTGQITGLVTNPTARIFLAFGIPDRDIVIDVDVPPMNATGPRFYRVHARARISGQKPMYMPMWSPVRGTVTLNGTTTVSGSGTFFVGGSLTIPDLVTAVTQPKRIRINGEIRNLVQVINDTTLLVDAPFTTIASGLTLESDSIRCTQATLAQVAGSAMMTSIIRAYPVGSEPQRPGVYAVVADDDVTDIIQVRQREPLEIVTSSPSRRLTLQSALATDPAQGVVEFDMLPKHADYIFDFIVEAGSVITFRNIADDNVAVFSLDATGFPADDDPRFPRYIQFPCLPSMQIDILGVEPWQEDGTILETEAGFPINGEAPSGALRI